MMGTWCSKHVDAYNKLIVNQKCCATSWLITKINRKTMLMGHNVPTNRLGLYFALHVWLTSLSLLSKMLVKFCVKIDHNYSCTEISNELTLRSYFLISPNRKTFLFDNSKTDSDVMPRILWNLKVQSASCWKEHATEFNKQKSKGHEEELWVRRTRSAGSSKSGKYSEIYKIMLTVYFT